MIRKVIKSHLKLFSFRIEGQRENKFEITFRTEHRNGIILWLNKGATTHGDYLSLAVANGFLELSFNLGKQKDLLIIRSLFPINDGLWHTVLIHRSVTVPVFHFILDFNCYIIK